MLMRTRAKLLAAGFEDPSVPMPNSTGLMGAGDLNRLVQQAYLDH